MSIVRVTKLLSSCCIVCNKRIWDINYYQRKPLGNLFENVQHDLTPEDTSEHEIHFSEIIKLIPGAPEEFKMLLQSQVQHFKKNRDNNKCPNRWPQEITQLCLSLWTRSPRSYEDLCKSGFLKLPSVRLLQYYKSSVKHTTGINHVNLKWMYQEAQRNRIQDREGGLLIDEMAIQEDLQISKRDGEFKFVGFVDMGAECNKMHILMKGESQNKLATHVLQITFLGYCGFRFPVACYASNTANAPELYTIFWDTVHHLQLYDFHVQYCCMDGANTNRTFMKMLLCASHDYKVKNQYGPGEIVLLQDYSHVIKKIRNSLCKSSHAPKSKRCLQKGNHSILWEHWVGAYNWDINTNPFTIHRKLTDQHIYLCTQGKMRNHFAEEVLNVDMLHLMRKYKSSLANGEYLNVTIELLEQTSSLILCFRDMRPIQQLSDDHLKQNRMVLNWFENWESEVSSMKIKEKEKRLISAQCREDLASLIIGFEQICQMRLSKSDTTVVPGRINSDPIENFFCQQRAKHHGANANPNYQTYLSGINSIIIGQSTVSNKSNARKAAAQPYKFQSAGPLKPKKMPRL